MPPIPPEGRMVAKRTIEAHRLRQEELQKLSFEEWRRRQEEARRIAEEQQQQRPGKQAKLSDEKDLREFEGGKSLAGQEKKKESLYPAPGKLLHEALSDPVRVAHPIFTTIKRLQSINEKQKKKASEQVQPNDVWDQAFFAGLKKLQQIDPSSEEFKVFVAPFWAEALQLCQSAAEMMEKMKKESDGVHAELQKQLKMKTDEISLLQELLKVRKVEDSCNKEEINQLRQMLKVKEDMLKCQMLKSELLNKKEEELAKLK